MGFFDKLKEEKERKEAEKKESERKRDLESRMEALAMLAEKDVESEDDYYLNDTLDQAFALHEAEPWLEIPAVIVRADEIMRQYGRRIVGIKEKYTLSQWLEAEKKARLEIEEDE